MDAIAVLVVDDEESSRIYLADFLGTLGRYQVRTASSAEQALEMLSGGSFDLVLLDVVMPQMSGLEALRRYRASGGAAPVIVLSGLSSADDVVRAMKLGATDYLAKPFDFSELAAAVGRALGHPVSSDSASVKASVPIAEPSAPQAETAPELRPEERQLIFVSPAMARARVLAERIADTDVPVLILGESGTGKEVIAREIHLKSQRRNRPFIKVNCAALPSELLESELFGHEKGAFTGATAEKPGKFELADRGVIFLDEIGEMPIRLQAKLLQVLQDEEFFRVGGKKSVRVDARVLVATNRELEREIQHGNFREDLYYRLNVVAIRVAPLRERKEDIVPLVEHFLKRYGRKYQNPSTLSELPESVLQAFIAYDWPGNVRELENMVRRLVVLNDPLLVLEELRGSTRSTGVAPPPGAGNGSGNGTHSTGQSYHPFAIPQPPPPPPRVAQAEMSLKDIGKRAAMLAEREAILSMLQRTAWNKRKAASKLKISYKALLYKIKESGIVDPRSSAEF
ncbi:MAG TPA: sigma-54 dependent transcriptional regulator [Myxococcaceae bacterium]|nr:sigma-54 dependent transcriptional regulator [Myxococcaceae bacterium]